MPEIFVNDRFSRPVPDALMPADEPTPVEALLALCPMHAPTPLQRMPGLAKAVGVDQLWVKDESSRMGLGSFKALGAAYAIAREAAEVCREEAWSTALAGRTYVTASAGNHGMSVAAGARVFGASAVIYLAEMVPQAFADRLAEKGADVRRAGADYEASMQAAEATAAAEGFILLSDSSWTGYTDMPYRVMEGYLQMGHEITTELDRAPTHVFLQAGVGGLAAAMAAHMRRVWGNAPQLIVVEPEAAPALIRSAEAGTVVTTDGPVSSMGRLDCKTPSLIALNGLRRDADVFVTITEDEAAHADRALAGEGVPSTPSGSAGLAAALAGRPKLPRDARVLIIVSEGPEA